MYDEIVAAIADIGATCFDISTPTTGGGRLLMMGYLGHNYLLFVLDPSRTSIITPSEKGWMDKWKGIVFPVETPEQLLYWLAPSTMA